MKMKLFSMKPGKYEGRHTGKYRKSKKSFRTILPVCLGLILAACFAVGGTLAFMQEQSGPVTNTFKAGGITYTLNLEANAAKVDHSDSEVDMPGELSAQQSTDLSVTFTLDKTPTLKGYMFSGWYYDAACGDSDLHTAAPGTFITVRHGDSHDGNEDANKVEITLYAKWTPNTYTVVYNGNGATAGSTANSTHIYDQELSLTANGYTRIGYKFLGWSTDSDATSATYADKENVKNLTAENDAEVELYAVWEQIDFRVSFDTQTNGEVANPADQKVTYQKTYGELPEVERTGYTFLGWTLEQSGTDYITKDSIVNVASNHTLYAQWDAKTYIIRYHANGGDGTMADQTIKYDVPTVLSKNTFTMHDYTFGGWALTSDGEVTYIDEQTVVNLKNGGYVDLYAIWIQDSHTVTFDYNGGYGSPASKQVQNGKEYGVLPTYPVHPTVEMGENEIYSYLFTGWYTAPTGGTRVYPATIVNRTDDHTLYAQWKVAPTNNVIKDLEIKNNPDDNGDGVVDAFYVNLTCSSSFEKLNIPLENLVVGQKYKLSFTESNNATYGMNEKGYGGAIYGFIITTDGTLSPGSIKEESIADGGLIKQFSDRYDGALNGPRNWETTFTAEASTMYWTWDYGLILDGYPRDYNYTNIQLVPVEPEIEFGNKGLVLYKTSKAQVLNDNSTAFTTNFVFDGDGYAETMYYPITGLTAGTTYTITFDHKFSGALINSSSYDYGCGIMTTVPTKYGSYMGSIGTWVSNCFVMSSIRNQTETVTLTFTATGDTAYWVWNMANCSDSTNCTIDVKVTNFSAKHSGGGSITYYSAPTQATLALETQPVEVQEISLIWDSIDDSYMDIWYPVDEQRPIAGDSYELAFEPMDGYIMSEIITIVIDDVSYEVYTDGLDRRVLAEGETELPIAPTFDPERGVLIIPGELLTMETNAVAVAASAVPVDVSISIEPEDVSDGDDSETIFTEGEEATEITVTLKLTNMTAQSDTKMLAGQDYALTLIPDEGYELPKVLYAEVNGVVYEVYTDGMEHRTLAEDETELPPMPTFDPETNTLTIPATLLGATTETVIITISAVEATLPPNNEEDVLKADEEVDEE